MSTEKCGLKLKTNRFEWSEEEKALKISVSMECHQDFEFIFPVPENIFTECVTPLKDMGERIVKLIENEEDVKMAIVAGYFGGKVKGKYKEILN